MDKGYIAPDTAVRKLRAARDLGQTVYVYGATGYGKTELVKQYLKSRRYQYFSCGEDIAGLPALAQDVPEGRKENRKVSRAAVNDALPSWLAIKENDFSLIGEMTKLQQQNG